MYTDSDGDFPLLIFIGVAIITALAVHGAIKSYVTAKGLGSEGWELAGYTVSGLVLGDYLPVKDNWDTISQNIDSGLTKDGLINFDFTSRGNKYYSIYTAGLYANYLKDNVYFNMQSRTHIGMYIELQGHFLAYRIGNSHGNPAFIGVPDWNGDWTAAVSENLADILYGISTMSPIY
ncbi:hypothetical protein RJI07_08675 [Mycoplasmatota bacterium WC30]